MKSTTTTSLFFVFAIFFQGLATAWQIPSFQMPLVPSWAGGKNPPSSAGVPRFILDTKHPWLSERAGDLADLPNIKSFLCSLTDDAASQNGDSFGGGDKSLASSLRVPADLFRKLEINNDGPEGSCDEWSNTIERLKEMRACPRALKEVRELDVDVYVRERAPWNALTEPLPALLNEVLGSMDNLEKLDWMIRGLNENAAIGEAFVQSGTRLGSVEELTANIFAPWLIDVCPSVKRLEARRDKSVRSPRSHRKDTNEDWVKAAGRLKGLKKLHLGNIAWGSAMAELDSNEFSDIDELWVGSFSGVYRTYPRKEEQILRNLTKTLSPLSNLKHLHLPWSAELDLGFDGGPLCGNFYMGEGGNERWLQVLAQNVEATERAGRVVREVVPQLKGVTVGDYHGNFTTDAEGREVILWEWTDRLDDWLLEHGMED